MSTETASAPRRTNRLTYTHFRALDHALLQENLPAAREAFSSLQEDSPHLAEIVQTTPVSGDSPRRTFLRRLAQALQQGELDVAQHAFTQFQDAATSDSRHPY